MKRTVVENMAVINEVINVRFDKQTLNEQGDIISSAWHRTSIPPDVGIDKQMEAVNLHLVSMGEAAVTVDEIAKIKSFSGQISG